MKSPTSKAFVLAHFVFFSTILSSTSWSSSSELEKYDKPELEFRLPSRGLRAYALTDLLQFQYVMLVAFDSKSCGPNNLVEFANALQRRIASKSSGKIKIVILDTAQSPMPAISEISPESNSHALYLFDSLRIVASQLLLFEAGDYAIVDPRQGKLLSSGSLRESNQHILGKSLEISRNQLSAIPKLDLPSCKIQYLPASDVKTTNEFIENFGRPFLRSCVRCHMQSDTYSFFATIDSVIAWRKMSLRTISMMRMPGTHFESQQEDLQKIVRFLDSPPEITSNMRDAYEKSYLEAREIRIRANVNFRPDLKLSPNEEFRIPNVGKARYLQIPIGRAVDSEFAISAIRLKTNLNAVHHLNLLLLPPGFLASTNKNSEMQLLDVDSGLTQWEQRGRQVKRIGIQNVLGTLNGKPHRFEKLDEPIIATFSRRDGILRFPTGTGVRVPKGYQFAIDAHIEPSGREELVTFDIELETLGNEQVYTPILRSRVRPGPEFRIPANSKSYISAGSFKLDSNIRVLTAWFHAHYRGVGSRIWYVTPEGKSFDLINNPFKQLKMSQGREFRSPGLLIPRGSFIHFAIEYDNSARNFANPDPNIDVKYGGSTILHEMHHPRIVYTHAE